MTILDEHRVDRMRSAVMDAVDADVRRRGRRTRVVVRTGAVLCTLALVAGVGAHLTSGHDTPASKLTGQASSASGSVAGALPGAADLTTSSLGRLPAASPHYGDDGRSVITTGSAHVLTDTPLKTADDFIAWVDGSGGRIDGQSDRGTGDKARVTLTVRVPDANSAIARLRHLGSVERVETDADDVTSQTTDLDARIKETKISIARLEAILARTSSVHNVLIAERALTTRQQQLESMVERRKTLSDQVALATLDVTFRAKASSTSSSPGWFHRNVLHRLGGGAGAALDAIGYLVPWLLLIGVVALLWAGVLRLTRRHG